ncbi:NAD(P)-dependent oxidoreductase [Roseibium sp. MMSF_3544]|uniref:NAD(P)-dependent oxidoreductase n=1 Tax=unclassified Roseibium TaxID=2629323 RepID=UPI00273E8F0D|nr:NAD(P)-dependent oxidoreductase [Roseibium sp. MMSF_3544]
MPATSRKPADRRRRRAPARIESLATLPLFFTLEGRRVVVAGGSDAAAWKAELLAAAGAEVHVFAEQLEETFSTLVSNGTVKGSIVHHRRIWSVDCFEGAALAIADAANEGEARAFYCAARSAGVPVNVIDTPRYCEFQFGSIVNRSPVVIGISTNGVAPILGQAIRRRIETMLPLSLRDWAALAGRIRKRVLTNLSAGAERRRFWERFTAQAFSADTTPETFEFEGLAEFLEDADNAPGGKVSLVDVCPGDVENLTLKAMRLLQSADVILFDDEIEDAVLELARREAERISVGRCDNSNSVARERAFDLMVTLVRQKKHVVRLKSAGADGFSSSSKDVKRLIEASVQVTHIPGVAGNTFGDPEPDQAIIKSDQRPLSGTLAQSGQTNKLPEKSSPQLLSFN